MSYDNSNSGALFSAADKKQKETDRDYSGNMEVTCPHCNESAEHWVSAWINVAASGKKYMKMKFNAKEAFNPTHGTNADGTAKPPVYDDDDVPF